MVHQDHRHTMMTEKPTKHSLRFVGFKEVLVHGSAKFQVIILNSCNWKKRLIPEVRPF